MSGGFQNIVKWGYIEKIKLRHTAVMVNKCTQGGISTILTSYHYTIQGVLKVPNLSKKKKFIIKRVKFWKVDQANNISTFLTPKSQR